MLCIRGGPAITYGACRRYVRNLLRAVLTSFGLPPALLPALPHPLKKVPLVFIKIPHPPQIYLFPIKFYSTLFKITDIFPVLRSL